MIVEGSVVACQSPGVVLLGNAVQGQHQAEQLTEMMPSASSLAEASFTEQRYEF